MTITPEVVVYGLVIGYVLTGLFFFTTKLLQEPTVREHYSQLPLGKAFAVIVIVVTIAPAKIAAHLMWGGDDAD